MGHPTEWFHRRLAAAVGAMALGVALYAWTLPSLLLTDPPIGRTALPAVTEATYRYASSLPRLVALGSPKCPGRLTVGMREIPLAEAFCDPVAGVFTVKAWLPSGETDIRFFLDVPAQPPRIIARVVAPDPLFMLFCVLMMALTCFMIFGIRDARPGAYWISCSFAAAVVARLLYVGGTSPHVRQHDFGGHIEYLQYVLDHWAIPHALRGWEFHQSPLYYFLAAGWARLGGFADMQAPPAQAWVQTVSLIVAVLCLPLMLWVSLQLFERRSIRAVSAHFLVVAFFPGLVFMAAQLSNDVLQQLVSFLWFGVLLLWWRREGWGRWMTLCLVTGIAIAVKMSSLLFLPVLLVCLLAWKLPWKRLSARLAAGGALIFVSGGWIALRRIFFERDLMRFSRSHGEPFSLMQVGNDWSDFLTFNPWVVLSDPYVSPWPDDPTRANMWAYLLRSMFAGEYDFGLFVKPLVVAMLALSLLGAALGAWALSRDCRKKTRHWAALPVAATGVMLLLGLVAYRFTGFACNQDFRFVPLLCAPFAYYLVRGCEELRGRAAEVAWRAVLALGILEAAFLFLL
jgi:hypothetical protein